MLQILKTTTEVLTAAAEYFVKTATEAIAANGKFTVALSGGSSPKGLYELLASQYHDQLEWNKVFFFFGDERNVPADHSDSNALMAKKALFDPLHIYSDHIYLVNTSLAPEAAAIDYQTRIEDFFSNGKIQFDLILLGLGDNSHTASLFPHTDVIGATEVGVKSVFLSNQKVYRITFTAPLINLAKHIAFLVFGHSKAEAIHHVLEDEKDYAQYPAQLIQPTKGDLIWFMDETAASMLKDKTHG